MAGYFISIIEAYEILVKNDEHINKIGFKFIKKWRKKFNFIINIESLIYDIISLNKVK